ncbi:hypothetical protein NliqN6_4408 [Naganishia liquefaciens]|uniref:FAD dependent oxidoreductase domain-containing protein n=1 Tax=Naganishia liquefaciens TaxID=104408 RepID=A0A8H3TUX4_9TREE|nr:hypothetical protein NliqN6_4408 [Naganishia liquefaciens]
MSRTRSLATPIRKMILPPSPTPCVSHWQATNRGPTSLFGHNALPSVRIPERADLVIIGGGTMGASLAYFLTRQNDWAGRSMVVLEARDVASGASGRNGGHIGPSTSEAFIKHQKPIGQGGSGVSEAESVRIVQSEIENLDIIDEVIKREKFDVDFWCGELCEVHESKRSSDVHKEGYQNWLRARQAHGVTGEHRTTLITDSTEAQKISRFPHAHSVQLRPAASVHSHRLCTALLQAAIASPNCDLFTHAPVQSLEKGVHGMWQIDTPRGCISAGKVVLCTNAYTKNFFDGTTEEEELLHSHIRPAYAQCSLITPPPSYSGLNALQKTYNMDGDFYLIQTPSGGMVLGGWDMPLVPGNEVKRYQRVGNEDDGALMPIWTECKSTSFLANYCRTRFAGWGQELPGEGATRTWSGLMTDSKDALPLVGAVPGKDGMYISAGFHGHGQSRIFIIAKHLAAALAAEEYSYPSSLPESFNVTVDRLERSRHVETEMDRYTDLTEEEMQDVALQAETMMR